MALSCSRFFRFLRSIAEPALAIVAFSCLLTFIFILYQPTHGPGLSQRVGWQSWDSVSSAGDSARPEDVGLPSTEPQEPPSSTDWWNVSNPEDEPSDTSSYPLDYWAPFLPHDTGLSEITIERCMFSPEFAGVDLCTPDTTPEKDAVKGKWVRVERDLNLQTGIWSLNIYYRRTRRLDVPLITEFQLLPSGEEPSPRTDSWFKVKRSIRDGVMRTKHLYLWYKIGKTMNEMSVAEKQQIVTEVDVLFGEGRPWYGFEKVEPAVTPEKFGIVESVYMTYRRGVKPVPRAPPLHFSQDGKFRILQVADLHFSVSRGECRDTDISPCDASDNLTSTLLGHVLDAEKPDMVVFTGDQLNGQGTSWDPKSVLAKFTAEVIDRKIPWAAVFGNHDDEIGAVKAEQLKMMQALPYSLVERGPKDIHGVGNYVLKVKSGDSSATHLLTLYFIDSGAYSKGYLDWFGYFFPTEYDWIHQDQIDWFLGESALIYPIERPYTPQTSSDLGDIWRRQSGQVPPSTRKLAKPNALMFFHIPLQESYSTPDTDQRTGLPLDIGVSLEGSGAAKKSDGMFEKGLLTALETDHLAGAAIPEVKVVANGHCHVTEDCKRIKDVWLCFGGGGSYSGYGRVGFDRRFRVYEISDYGETIRTYKRTEHDEVLNDYILAGEGAAPYNSQH